MKKNRVGGLFLAFVLCLSVLFSCTTNKNESNGAQNNGSVNSDNAINIVVSESTDVDISKIETALSLNGDSVQIVSESAAEAEHELVIGNTSRKISDRAYRHLEDILDAEQTCWLIYAYDGKLCIAYDSGYALDEAIKYFASNIAGKDNLFSGSGIIAKDKFDTVEYIEVKREEAREPYFTEIEKELGEDATNSLRNLYTMYGTKTYTWLANLYDPVAGGFYYSNSGRNTVGYLPDLESTWQAIRHLAHRGMFVDFGGDMAAALPDEVKTAIVNFTKGLQSEEDGYFYHPQWDSVGNSRLGRDLSWATNILEAFGDAPLYDTPNGVKGSLSSHTALTSSLKVSGAKAISRIISTSKSALPDYLTSLDLWAEHIESLEISKDSYHAGNQINAINDQIKNAGAEYIDYLINYLNDAQYSSTGLWESGITYQGVNGLMKISSTYSALGRAMPNIEAALNSAISIALSPEFDQGQKHICSVYNPWVAMSNILSAAKKSSDSSRVDALRQIILKKADELIAMTTKKISMFYRGDGSFSYYELYTTSASQGAPVALSHTVEGDVNATTISCSTIDIMLECLDVETPPFYCSSDYEYFTDLLLSMGEIIKDTPREQATGPITFDNFDPDFGNEINGIVMSPDDRVSTALADEQKDSNGFFKWFQSSVVPNPDPTSSGDDLVFKANTYIDKEDTKQQSSTMFSNQYMMNTSAAGNTYVFESDIWVSDNENTDYPKSTLLQIFFDNDSNADKLFAVNVGYYTSNGKTYLKLTDNWAGLDGVRNMNLVDSIPTNEWFKLRVECYKIYDDLGILTVKAKIFVNGKYCCESDSGFVASDSDVYTDAEVNRVRIGYYRYNQGEFYFNNVIAEISANSYVSEEPVPEEIVKTPATFEDFNSSTGNVLAPEANITNNDNDAVIYEITSDPKNAKNKVLKVTNDGSAASGTVLRTQVDLQPVSDKGSMYIFESDIYIDSSTRVTTFVLELAFTAATADAKALSGIRVGVDASGNVYVREYCTSVDGNVTMAEKIATTNSWFRLAVQMNYIDSENVIIKLFVDGALLSEINAYNTANSDGFDSRTFRVRYPVGANTLIYLDNMSYIRSDNEYVYVPKDSDDEPEKPEEDISEYVPSAEVMPVKGGANGIVVLVHDDGTLSTASVLDKLYKKYSLVGDVALIANRVYDFSATTEKSDAAEWRKVLATDRWGVISHSSSHHWWGSATDDGNGGYVIADDEELVDYEIVQSQKALEEALATQVLTFAYPGFGTEVDKYAQTNGKDDLDKILQYIYSENVRELIEKYFIAARMSGYGNTYSVNNTSIDWSLINSLSVYNGSVKNGTVIDAVGEAASSGLLQLFHFHKVVEVDESEVDTYSYGSNEMAAYYAEMLISEVAKYAESGEIWNTHFADAVIYLREAQTATVSVTGDLTALTVTLTDEMDNSLYSYALTVRVKVPTTWEAVKIVQGDTVSYVPAKNVDGKWVIDAEIVPDAGSAVITPIAASAIPTVTPTESKLAYEYVTDPDGDTQISDGVVTFENGDPDCTEEHNLDKVVVNTSADDPTGAANKVMSVTNPATSTTGAVICSSLSCDGGTVGTYVFESDIYIDSANSKNYMGLFVIGIGDNYTPNKRVLSEIYVGCVDGKIVLTENNSSQSGNITLAEAVASGNEWFKLRFEMDCIVDDTGAYSANIRLYVNEKLVGEAQNSYNTSWEGTNIDTVRIRHYRGYNALLYFDNISFSKVADN
ncbi:MAG: hypothetical protein J6B48_07795 [Clostridia bacterium]|nr:hypothetical protein [Clostridia bacterium]